MKIHATLGLLLLPLCSFGQLKQIAFSELSSGSGMFFGAEMTPTTITVTLQGPSDRFLAFGLGTGMASGNDAIIWSTLGSGAAPLILRDHRMVGQGTEPTVDAQQDWTVISNNVSGGNRTIVASRALNTGDANDFTINFSNTTQNLFWAKSASASNQIAYHGSNRASGIVRNWVLVDQTPPTVNSFTPADNASGISLTANLVASFNENIAFGTGSITLYDENDAVVQTVSNGSPGLTITNGILTWNPAANLVVNTDYYIHIDPTAITDIAGNPYAGFTNNTTWNFNTNDVTAPLLTASPFVPADNAAGVALTTNLSLTFNENVMAGTGEIELFNGGGTLIQSFDAATNPFITFTNANVTINPSADLVLNTDYYVHIAAGAIKDLSGNSYAGISNNTTWNFNTNESTPPALVPPFVPADDAVNVLITDPLEIMFSEPIAITATGALKLFLANGTLVQSFTNLSSGLTVATDKLIITPAATLSDVTAYYVTVDAGLVTDLLGNPYAGFSNTTTWNFTTGDFTPPLLITLPFVPADNELQADVQSMLTATFNEPIAFGTGLIRLVDDTDGTGSVDFDVTTSPAVTISGNTLTINPVAALEANTAYHILIASGSVRDLSANGFDGITNATTWNFSTEDDAGISELSNSGLSWNGTILTFDAGTKFSGAIYDAAGKLVKAELGQSTDCSDLVSGVYFVRVQSENNLQSFRIYVR